MTVSLVADLVVVVGELAEAGAVWVADDGLPATPQLAARGRVEVLRAPRLHDDRAEQTMVRLLPRVAVAVERVRSLLGIVRDSPFVDDGLAGGSDRIGVGGDGWRPRASQSERRAVQVKTRRLVVAE